MMTSKYKLIVAWLPLLFCFLMPTKATAQDDFSGMNLRLVYIAHETTTPVKTVCEKLRKLYDEAVEMNDPLIVYLSDGKDSPMAFVNLKDITGRNADAEDAFDNIIAALQNANSHDVDAREDRRNILELFDAYNFVDDMGRLRFGTVDIDFYVGPRFWSLGNNEKVISHLFVALNAGAYPPDKFKFSIWKLRGLPLGYPGEGKGGEEDSQDAKPFGDKNIDDVNRKLRSRLLPYEEIK